MNQATIRNQILIWILLLGSVSTFSQIKNDFEPRYKDNLRGDITFIANNIVNRQNDGYSQWVWISTGKYSGYWDEVWVPAVSPNDPYNTTGSSSEYNDDLNMRYIDVDNDNSTFSSSSAELSIPEPDCSRIRYAGLYWSAVYKYNDGNDSDSGRNNDFNKVKFKIPGGAYQDLTADEVLFDGFNDTDFGSYSPYACYKDVTSIVTSLSNPNGDYFVANVRASNGSGLTGGISGGWTLVVVYENPGFPGKYITTFDGYAGIKTKETLDIPINGFTTLPNPFPVLAKIGVATLEGDNKITGDGLSIMANSNSTFTALGNTVNPTNNFFNANITKEDNIIMSRNPNSINTLGWDVDMFTINNSLNKIIPNDETGATLRASSTQDKYDIFFTSFDVEIIEPEIILEKKVEDIAGNDITGQGVHLGQILDYVLNFQNIGNDDAVNYTIKDVLPINVTLDESSFVFPPGVTYTYDPATRTVTFSIPDDLVNQEDPVSSIRMRVKVAENCFDFIDACSDKIENLAYSTYRGLLNDNEITDNPSIYEFNHCGFVVPGATNFLLDDLADCTFARTVQICGDDVLLDAGDGFDSYVWYRDNNDNSVIDAGDTPITDGDPDNDPSTMSVNNIGSYIVDKLVADPCKGFKEYIKVERFGTTQTNPIIDYLNTVNSDADPNNDIQGEIVTCSIDGDLLPKIFLCGSNATELLQVNIPDAQSIVWEKLDEGSCAPSGEDCSNKNGTCTWNQVATGNSYNVNMAGQFRLVLNYQNGCSSRFYFNVFQNTLDIQYNASDIICSTPGNITITNLGNGYGYQLYDVANNTIVVPFSDHHGPDFDIATKGAYRVDVVQLDSSGNPIDGSCIFSTPEIGIRDRDFQVNITSTPANCNELGKINIQVLNVEPNYSYELRLDDGSNGGQGSLVDDETAQPDNNYTFQNLNPDNYIVITKTDDGCIDTQKITIDSIPELTLEAMVSQNITCSAGNILMTPTGGTPPYTYALWSYTDEGGNGGDLYTSVGDIPPSAFQAEDVFETWNPGDYTFIVVDRNNCYAFSNKVNIQILPAADFDPVTITDVLCYGSATGSIKFNLVDNHGYQLTYFLFETATFDPADYEHTNALATNSSGNFPGLAAGDYTIVINQSKGAESCDFIQQQTVSGPSEALDAEAVLVEDYTCIQSGSIKVQNVVGGTAPYEYSIDGVNFVATDTFSDLNAGSYSITVRDANGCTVVTDPIPFDSLNPPSDLTFNATAPTCPALVSDLTATVVNGNAPYTFEITAPSAITATSTSGNTASFNGLAAGTYTFKVTDAKGCEYTENYTISPITPISAVGNLIRNISCYDDTDGQAQFIVSGFGTSFDYTITGPSNFSGTAETNGTIALDNLDDGTYTITVTDNITHCTATADVVIAAPPAALSLNIDEIQPTCTADGSVVLTANNGWGGYSYTIVYPDGTTTFTNSTGRFNSLNQLGIYNVTVTDANGCTISDSFNLSEAVAPILDITANSTCFVAANGLELTATVTSGGDGNFEYSLNGGSFTANNVFPGLNAGTYTITVRDGKNCTGTDTITIDPELTVTASAPNITSCDTETDVTITAAGGDGNYVYAIVADGGTPITFSTTNPVSVTGTGDYDVYVRDNGGNTGYCEAIYNITISQDPPVVISETHLDVSCNSNNDGSITLSASGGAGNYTYSIDGGTNFTTSATFNNLTAGTYNVVVRDKNNCEDTATITLSEPDAISAIAIATDYTCAVESQITVNTVVGGSGTYQYRINGQTGWLPVGGTTDVTYTFTATFTDGTYVISVRDFNAQTCSFSTNVTIDPLPAAPVLSTTVTYNCDGSGNLTVTAAPNGAYEYQLEDTSGTIIGGYDYASQGTSNVFENIPVGNYVVRINYGTGNTALGTTCNTTIPVRIEAGHEFDAAITTSVDVSCNGGADGSITIEAENFGPGGFEYSLDGFATTLGSSITSPVTITGLAADSYTITVRDVDDPIAGCTVTLSQNITEPSILSVSHVLTPKTCITDGSVTINATGGSGGYQYQIEQPDNTVLGPQSGKVFNGLGQEGTYTITVTDSKGCTATDTFDIVAPTNPVASIDPSSSLCYSSGSLATVVIGASDGLAPYYYSMNGGPKKTSNTFTGLTPGDYTFTVTDSNGCSDDILFTIEPQLTANVVLTKDIDCSVSPDAILDLTVNGGYAPFTYEMNINGGGYVSYPGAFPYSTLTIGTYQFRVTDSRGCVGESNIVTVTAAVPPQATATVQDPTCNGEANGIVEINIDPNFGTPPFKINFNGLGDSSQTVYTNLAAGTYSYTVTDSKNCTYTDTVTLNDPAAITANFVANPITCGGSGNILGSIDISGVTGGTGNYTYFLYDNTGVLATTSTTNPTGPTTDTSLTFDELDFGNYYVRIVDDNNCEYNFGPYQIASPIDALDIVPTASANCITGVTYDLAIENGIGPFKIRIYNLTGDSYIDPNGLPATSGTTNERNHSYSNLLFGISYVFEVLDTSSGCTYIEQVPAVASPSSIDIDATATDITCNGSSDGQVDFTISGYDGDSLGWEIFQAPSGTSTGISGSATGLSGADYTNLEAGLPAGDYYLLVNETDPSSTQCSNTYSFRILEPTPLELTLVDQNNANCFKDAQVTVNASGGTAPYTYAFVEDGTIPGVFGSSNYAELDPDENTNWDVYVKDAHGCIDQLDVVIAADPEPVISTVVTNQCAAEEGDFTIQVTLDNAGVGPYMLSLDGGAFQPAAFTLVGADYVYTYTGLSSGTHTVELKDANTCGNKTPDIEIYPPSTISVEITAEPTCMGNDGEIFIKTYGGSGDYMYELFDGAISVTGGPQSSPTFTGLDSKTYRAFIYDQQATGCEASTDITLSVPPAVIFTTSKIDVTCNGGNDGSITVTLDPSMENYPYTYALYDSSTGTEIRPPQASNTFTRLEAKDYYVRVTSSRLCFADADVTIEEPDSIVVPIAAVAEFGCAVGNNPDNASITINTAGITGGSGTYVRYEFINDDTSITVQDGAKNSYIETNPVGGHYTINVYDSNGCMGSTTAIIAPFVALTDIVATSIDPNCNPGSNGEVKVDVTLDPDLGTTSLQYDITGTDVVYSDTFTGNVDTYTFTGLEIGNYLITVTNTDTGCFLQTTAELKNPNTFDIDILITNDVVCFGSATGTVEFSITDAVYTDGFNYQVFEQGTNTPMTAVLNQIDLGPTPALSLPVGDYYVSISQDSNPFCTNQKNFTIAGPSAALTAATDVKPITCLENDGVIEIVNVTGGWGGYAYYVSTTPNPDPTDVSNYVTASKFENLIPGDYEIWVIDQNGCALQLSNEVLDNPDPITAILQVNQENCTNLEGEIQVVGTTGGQGSNYTYQLIKDGVPYGSPQTSDIFSGLGAGTYSVQISDQWSCDFTTLAEILLYEEIDLTATVVKPMDCSAIPGGEITITAQGGSGNLEYTVTFPDGTTTVTNTDGIFTGLDQDGVYSFTVKDLDTSAPVCEKTITQSLDAPTPVTLADPDIVDVSCYGLSDGSITVNLMPRAAGVNDNPIYTYNLYDATGTTPLAPSQTNPLFSGLAAGTYQVEAVSSRDCSARRTVEVKEPTELLIDATATSFNCDVNNVASTATISVAILDGATTPGVSSGTGPYLYSLDDVNYQTSNTFTIIDTGNTQSFTIYVKDGNGCPATDTVTIEPLNKFTAALTQDVAITCAGPEQVTITVSDNGNTSNAYTFELLPVGNTNAVQTGTPTYNSATFNLTAVGSYTFRVTDTATGCYVDTAPYTIAPYDLIKVVATATTPVTCFGETNGALEINVTGYSGTYNYEVFDSVGNSIISGTDGDTSVNPHTIPGLPGGNYFVRVTETNSPSCVEDSNTVTIASPTQALTATLTPAANVTCTNDAGELIATASGGWGDYEYQLINTSTGTTVQDFDSNAVFTGLSAGDYTLNVRDSGGCLFTDTAQLIRPDPITADITATPTMLACYGDSNAMVSAINVLGGQGSYQYQLNIYDPTGTVIDYTTGGQTGPNFDNLGAGIYSITVSDGWNCDVETAKVTIEEPTGVTADLIRTQALTCTQDAILLLTASGGTGPYDYSTDGITYFDMSDGDSHIFNNVSDGTYRYYVRDSFGCKSILSNEIKEDPIEPLTVVLDDTAAVINCNGESTATIIAKADGGLGNYRYELFSDAALTDLVAGPKTNGKFDNLVAGDYYVKVTSEDCTVIANVVTITEPAPLQVTDDFGNITCNGAADGFITVELSGGSGDYQYAISPNLNKFESKNTFTGLEAGTYTVIAQDKNGCFEQLEYTITEPALLEMTATVQPELCVNSEDGSISVVITGGTAPYSTSLNSNADADYVTGQTEFTNLAVGSYVIFVKDAAGCETNIVAEVQAGMDLNATVTPHYECTGNIPDNFIEVTLADPSVSGDVLYGLDTTDPSALVLEPDFTNMAPGAHYLTIAHANGCTNTIEFTIDGFEPLALTLQQSGLNEITALATGGKKDYTFQFNDVDNGSNNTFTIKKSGTYTVTVTDANGCVMSANIEMEFLDVEIPKFFTPDGDGENDFWSPENIQAFPQILTVIYDRYGRVVARLSAVEKWDGLYKTKELPSGDYWYVVKLNGAEDDREFVGHFTLYR